MLTTAAGRAIRDQRGVAMVLTLFILLILTSLAIAFAMLGASEPQITANLQQSAEAMGLAEAGIERVIWALNNAQMAFPLPTTIPAPYNGTIDFALGTGVYRVTVTAGATNAEVVVTSEARVPAWASYKGRRIVTANVTGLLPKLEPPCAICMKGALRIRTKTIIDSRTSNCGSKQGSHSTDLTNITTDPGYGVFSNDADPTVPNQATDYFQNVAASSFDSFKLTRSQLDLLKDLAKADGTYYKGAVTFTGSVPSGIVFVDTVSGNPINPLNPADFGSLTINGDVGAASGWIVVMGNFSGPDSWSYSGLIYVANTMARYRPQSLLGLDSTLRGALIIQNISDSTQQLRLISSGDGATRIHYSCDNIRSAGGKYPAFFVKPGTWREISG